MKINIGPYKEWIGPYQIAEKLFFWMGDDKQHKIGTWLSKDKDGNDSYLNKFCKWIDSKKHRKIEVKIDGYDVWSMDQTLAYIILPMLIKLQDENAGAGHVDDSDCPIWLHSTVAPGKESWDTDEHWHDRWQYVLNEMIWAFNEKAYGSDSKFFTHPPEDTTMPFKERMQHLKVDHVGMDKYHKRMQNGFRLFGKYFSSLWT